MVTDTIKKVANAILDAGEGCQSGLVYVDPVEAAKAAIAVLSAEECSYNAGFNDGWEAANGEPPESALSTDAEPVAWGNFKDDGTLVGLAEEKNQNWIGAKPLYVAPPAPSVAVKALTLDALKHYFECLNAGDFSWSEMPTSLYTYLLMDGYVSNESARHELRSALSAQVQDVAITVEAFDRNHPELYWHIAKGKITAGEPLYGAIITDLRGNELGDGESNVSAIDAFNIAVEAAALAAKLEEKP